VSAWSSQSIVNKPYLAVDSAGRIYATDPEGYRILVFDQNGNYIGRFGSFGTEVTQFGLPVGIAVDEQDNIYVVDSANNRVMKFPPLFGPPPTADEVDEAEILTDPVEEEPTEEESAVDPTISPTP
jgi:DNA-binding beta-propeller fold protein YncE